MFPDKVYYCPCLKIDVMMCLVNGDYSLNDIIRKAKRVLDFNQYGYKDLSHLSFSRRCQYLD